MAKMANPWDELDTAWRNAEPAKAGANYEPIPEGTEVCVVATKQEFKFIGAKATPCCKVTFEVAAADNPEHIGRFVWHDFWLTPANAPYLKRDLGILGWRGERLSVLTDPADTSLMHLGARVKLGVEKYTDAQGEAKKKNVIRFFNEPYVHDGAASKAAPAQEEDYPF